MNKSIFLSAFAVVAFSTVVLAANLQTTNFQNLTAFNAPTGTPLCVAIQKGEFDLVKKMVEYGANVNELSSGMTPLMVAARYNKVEIIKFLLANGAHANVKDDKGFTALKYAELSMANEAALVLKQA
jgi:ankyrin repeat protein